MKNSIINILIVLILSINSFLKAHSIADEHTPLHNNVTDRMREFSHEGIDYNIFYTTYSSSSHRVTVSDVDNMQDYIIESYDGLVDGVGFRIPWQSILPDYDFVVKNSDMTTSWYAMHSHIVLRAQSALNRNEQEVGVITLHEIFHNVQRNYMRSVFGTSTAASSLDASNNVELISLVLSADGVVQLPAAPCV